ncbi:hypothetical protein OS493_001336 [Desmophyllum pertusum]|uniref:Uncharacterized protein n=1 Tax=Desmophyllum pertusum TaxID=174260 RepID=A0A9W9ZH41_9CNID|nr:hypothetical protein OS493_001336 [Desmophyllum pertusum]
MSQDLTLLNPFNDSLYGYIYPPAQGNGVQPLQPGLQMGYTTERKNSFGSAMAMGQFPSAIHSPTPSFPPAASIFPRFFQGKRKELKKANEETAQGPSRSESDGVGGAAHPRTCLFRRGTPSADDVPDAATNETSAVEPQEEETSCQYCLQAPCVVMDGRPRGPPRNNNHAKRLKDYRFYYTLLNARLWENPLYLARKEELGCHIDDIREVIPMCVVKDVRPRWPNPPHIPYMGHKRS